ncbi:MAG: DUF1501 domain-containing protein [Phycisphaerales bacterium]|nr:DUF1501 domain-containing protein [Phycisphaerales bacterium]
MQPYPAPYLDHFRSITRRHFLGQCRIGVGAIALASLMGGAASASPPGRVDPFAPRPPHFPARAKRVIWLHMAGSPPQQDLFDYKPLLNKLNGQPCPDELLAGERFAFIKGHPKVLGSPYKFARHGQSGAWISELMPNLASIADDLTIVRSMRTDQFNHAPAQLFLYTGSPLLGRPSFGSWVTYGLGTEASDLPGFVVLVSGNKTPSAGKSVWGSGFLPTVFQGVQCRTSGDPVLYVTDPDGMDRESRRGSLDALRRLNELEAERSGAPETATRISQYELAFRMQVSVPDVMDISRESPETIEAYGAAPGETRFANNCLLARRLVERGVRFVQLFDWGWDTHGTGPYDDIITQLPKKCGETDRPIAALITDLKRRGLLDETLVVWSGEFGRTCMNEERNGSTFLGRDHHPHCFSMFMAGGGARPGYVHGETNELGSRIVSGDVHVHDLQATILRLLGMDHERLTYRFQGRDFRLTDVHGRLVPELMA